MESITIYQSGEKGFYSAIIRRGAKELDYLSIYSKSAQAAANAALQLARAQFNFTTNNVYLID